MITRSIDENKFDRVCKDFGFLVERIHKEQGELDLRLRDNYFNLYYKGNSLAKVRVGRIPYQIEINKAFAAKVIDNARFGTPLTQGDYFVYKVAPKALPAFLSKAVIDRLYRQIKLRNYCEELIFEQLLIADNRNRHDLVFIDRQITGGPLGRARIDLLALRQTEKPNEFRFEVVEVKLGNNPELKGVVADQMQGYVDLMEKHFDDFKTCYERTYRQMRSMELLKEPDLPTIDIVLPVKGVIVVGGYPGLARKAQEELILKHPSLSLKSISYQI